MENNFLLYFFALAFIIAWGGVVICSARSVILSMEKDKKTKPSSKNGDAVGYSDKAAYFTVYNLEKNTIFFIPKDRISKIRINAEVGVMTAVVDGKEYVATGKCVFFYVSEAEVAEYFHAYRHTADGLKSWLAYEVGLGYFACMPDNNEFRLMYEREVIASLKKSKE